MATVHLCKSLQDMVQLKVRQAELMVLQARIAVRQQIHRAAPSRHVLTLLQVLHCLRHTLASEAYAFTCMLYIISSRTLHCSQTWLQYQCEAPCFLPATTHTSQHTAQQRSLTATRNAKLVSKGAGMWVLPTHPAAWHSNNV